MRRKTHLPENVWVAGGVSLLNDASSEMIYPLLPLFITSVLGASRASLGLIEGVAEATASLVKVLSGILSDRFRRRRMPMLLGYGLSLVSRPFIAVAGVWETVFGARFVDRIGKGVRTSPRDALLVESVPFEKRGLAFGVHRAMDTAGAVLGPAIAIILLGLYHFDMRRVFWISIIPGIGALFMISLIKDPEGRSVERTPPVHLSAVPRGAFRDFLWITALFTLANSSDTFLLLRAHSCGFSTTGVVGVFMAFNVFYALVAAPIGALSDRWGRRRVTELSFFYYAALYAGFAFVDSRLGVLSLFILYGPFQVVEEGVKKAYVSELVPGKRMATGMGIYNAVRGLALLPASLMTGMVWDRFGAAWAFGVDSLLAAAAGILFLCFVAARSKHGEKK